MAGQDGWAPSQRDSSSHEEEFKRCLRLAGAHFQWRRANDPCWKPVAAPDEPAARAAVADQLLRMRMRQAWFGQNGGDFLVLEGERVALLLADAQLVREEYAADVHYAPPQGSANKTSRLGSCMRCTRPLVTCVRLATRLPDTLMCLTPTFAYSSRFRSGKVLLPAQAAKSSRHKADRGIIKWRASTGPH